MADIGIVFLALLVHLWLFLHNVDDVNIISCIFGNAEFNYNKTKALTIIREPQRNDLIVMKVFYCNTITFYSAILQA